MPFLKFSRDKRGYEHFALVEPGSTRRGKSLRPRVLFLFRTPPQIKVGREPFTADVRTALETQNPGLRFDWDRLMATPIPPPDADHWRERRRAEKAARQAARGAAEQVEAGQQVELGEQVGGGEQVELRAAVHDADGHDNDDSGDDEGGHDHHHQEESQVAGGASGGAPAGGETQASPGTGASDSPGAPGGAGQPGHRRRRRRRRGRKHLQTARQQPDSAAPVDAPVTPVVTPLVPQPASTDEV